MMLRIVFFLSTLFSTTLGLPLSDHVKSLLDKTSAIYEATSIRVLDIFGIDHNLEPLNLFDGLLNSPPPRPPITRENPYLPFNYCPNTTEILQFQKHIVHNQDARREYQDTKYRFPIHNYQWPEFYMMDFYVTAVWCNTTDMAVNTNPTRKKLVGSSGVVVAKPHWDHDDRVGVFMFEDGGRSWGFLYNADIPWWIRGDAEEPVDFTEVKLDWMDAVKVNGNNGKVGFNQVAILNGEGKEGPVYRFFEVTEPYDRFAYGKTMLTISAEDGRILDN